MASQKGEKSVTTLPSNRSIIIADSRFRTNNSNDTPYHFLCKLGGTGIYAKDIYYQKLFWNQPIFSHTANSCELRFQFCQDVNPTVYVVYATPFVMYNTYDGNPPGTSLLAPQPGSYAYNMELALNGDIRTVTQNTTLINGDGILRDVLGNIVTLRFRYSPSRGFCIYPVQNIPLYPLGYTISLLPCDYIKNAHYVHGFGVYDPILHPTDYIPLNMRTTAYWSDCTPNLLPFRYIVIQSSELNKDRRMISFHNGNFANFINELAMFSLNPVRTGVFHEAATGDDTTVVSLRHEYTPQSFHISITDEYGGNIYCSDPIGNMFRNSSLFASPTTLQSYLIGPLAGRGDALFMNNLVFGYRASFAGIPGYLPPASEESSYQFGNPLAIALCEEVIHEIASINEYN